MYGVACRSYTNVSTRRPDGFTSPFKILPKALNPTSPGLGHHITESIFSYSSAHPSSIACAELITTTTFSKFAVTCSTIEISREVSSR